MRRLLGCGTLILILIGAVLFVRGWNRVTTYGTGTGNIPRQIERGADKAGDAVGSAVSEVADKAPSKLRQIARNPLRFKGSRQTVTGRVRSATKIASNRNLYLLVEGDDRILVIDDKAPPRPYYPRTVTGVVQTVAEVGGSSYAYVTDVKSGVKVNAPSLNQVRGFFSDKYEQVRQGVREELARP